VQIATKQFSPDTIQWFPKACESGTLSCRALAHEFCEREQWFDYAGRANLASASPVLIKIAERLGVALPRPRHWMCYSDYTGSGTLRDMGILSLVPVTGRDDGRLWESMLETHHPEGWHRAPDRLIQYWIVSSTQGILDGISFSAATFYLGNYIHSTP